jgi:hypothetical protein
MTAIIPTSSATMPTSTTETFIAATEPAATFEAIFENAHASAAKRKSAPMLQQMGDGGATGDDQPESALSASAKNCSSDEADKLPASELSPPQTLPANNPEITASLVIQGAQVAQVNTKSADSRSTQPGTSAAVVASVNISQPLTKQIIPDQPFVQRDTARAFQSEPAIQKRSNESALTMPVEAQPAVTAKSNQPLTPKVDLQAECLPKSPAHPADTSPLSPLAAPAPALTAAPTAPLAIPPTEPYPILDLTKGDLWLDQLTREIVALAGEGGKLRFSLTPEALGQSSCIRAPRPRGRSLRSSNPG